MKVRSVTIIVLFLVLGLAAVILCPIILGLFLVGRKVPAPITVSTPGLTTPVPKPAPASSVFDTFGPSDAYLPASGWAAGACAHAESFVPARSGPLRAIAIAIEPGYLHQGRETMAGEASVFLACDQSGFPGPVLERFRVAAAAPTAAAPPVPVVLESMARPTLQAGVKYWLCAESAGPVGWVWRFNPRNLTDVSARQDEAGKWFSAGNGRDGAFRVTLTEQLEQVPP